MPGCASRRACNWIMSLARSRTAPAPSLLILPARAAELRQLRLAFWRRRRISAPDRSSTPARTRGRRRGIRGSDALRRCPTSVGPTSSNCMPRKRAMPWLTCTTRSPSARSRKLSMARDSRWRRGSTCRTSSRWNNSWPPRTTMPSAVRDPVRTGGSRHERGRPRASSGRIAPASPAASTSLRRLHSASL